MDFGNQGARTERPYPPSSMNDNSCLRSSSMSRSSLAMSKSSSLPENPSSKPLLLSYEIPASRTATDMPSEKSCIRYADHIAARGPWGKDPQVMSENAHTLARSVEKAHKLAGKRVGTSVAQSRLPIKKDKAGRPRKPVRLDRTWRPKCYERRYQSRCRQPSLNSSAVTSPAIQFSASRHSRNRSSQPHQDLSPRRRRVS